ncbi:MAG: hypothetical protein KAS40_13045, partial [Desulfobacterales bacterium]|nr:hypothetical protein [Desulfobacterales bacterium]
YKKGAVAKYRWILAPTIIIPAITIAYSVMQIPLLDKSVVRRMLSVVIINVINMSTKLLGSCSDG